MKRDNTTEIKHRNLSIIYKESHRKRKERSDKIKLHKSEEEKHGGGIQKSTKRDNRKTRIQKIKTIVHLRKSTHGIVKLTVLFDAKKRLRKSVSFDIKCNIGCFYVRKKNIRGQGKRIKIIIVKRFEIFGTNMGYFGTNMGYFGTNMEYFGTISTFSTAGR